MRVINVPHGECYPTRDTTTSLTCVSSVSDAELEKLQKAFEDAL